jgi:hypothetical protein
MAGDGRAMRVCVPRAFFLGGGAVCAVATPPPPPAGTGHWHRLPAAAAATHCYCYLTPCPFFCSGCTDRTRPERPNAIPNGHDVKHAPRLDSQCHRYCRAPKRRKNGVRGFAGVELCTWREPTRPGVGSLTRKRHTQYVEQNRKGHP